MKLILILASALFFLPTQKQLPTSTIRGTVTSESTGKTIAGATIALSRSAGTTNTGKNGTYLLPRVSTGVFDLTISAPGYIPLTFMELEIPPGISLDMSAKLRKSTGKPGENIAIKISGGPRPPSSIGDKMPFYQPDSTVDFKIRILNPDSIRPKSKTSEKE